MALIRDGKMITEYAPQASAPAAGGPFELDQNESKDQERLDYIRALYREELGREADAEGLDYWNKSGLQGADLIKWMRISSDKDRTTEQDQGMNAFMRKYNQQRGTIEADRQRRLQELKADTVIKDSMLDRQKEKGLTTINDNAESRGMYQSGGRTRQRGEYSNDIEVQRYTDKVQTARESAAANRTATDMVSDLSRQRDDAEIAARSRMNQKSMEDYQRDNTP